MAYAEVQALEEGVTEAYAVQHFDEFLERLGIEEICPGITDPELREPSTYPQFTPGAEEITRLAGEASGRGGAEVLRLLAVENPAWKWRVLTAIVVEPTGLMNELPKEQQGGAQLRVAQAMWKHYAGMVDLGGFSEKSSGRSPGRSPGGRSVRGWRRSRRSGRRSGRTGGC
ncbi:hypothetical protein AB0E69_15435 [Kribbella sp. NPDC026611]|uniref:hypothetical protein n=1 Tax=Kribbella sp. NPDC026611 TaxID=3154911 RepID=UPI0033E9FC18